jgi:hypothetical protein
MQHKMSKIVVIKPHRYGTRHLVAGDEYELPARQALALIVTKKARFAKPVRKAAAAAPVPAPAQPAAPAATRGEPSGEIENLRAQATQLGIDIDGRWGVARLRYEIERTKR